MAGVTIVGPAELDDGAACEDAAREGAGDDVLETISERGAAVAGVCTEPIPMRALPNLTCLAIL
mgnify:CR=1 FL=1